MHVRRFIAFESILLYTGRGKIYLGDISYRATNRPSEDLQRDLIARDANRKWNVLQGPSSSCPVCTGFLELLIKLGSSNDIQFKTTQTCRAVKRYKIPSCICVTSSRDRIRLVLPIIYGNACMNI